MQALFFCPVTYRCVQCFMYLYIYIKIYSLLSSMMVGRVAFNRFQSLFACPAHGHVRAGASCDISLNHFRERTLLYSVPRHRTMTKSFIVLHFCISPVSQALLLFRSLGSFTAHFLLSFSSTNSNLLCSAASRTDIILHPVCLTWTCFSSATSSVRVLQKPHSWRSLPIAGF